jgi:hypothetical protein
LGRFTRLSRLSWLARLAGLRSWLSRLLSVRLSRLRLGIRLLACRRPGDRIQLLIEGVEGARQCPLFRM